MNDERQIITKTIATPPGQPDIVVELTEAEYADYYERLNNPPKPTLSGGDLSGYLRELFKTKPLSYRVIVLKEIYPVLDILERDPSLTEAEYLEFVDVLTQIASGVMPQEDIQATLLAVSEFVSKHKFHTI